MSKSYNKVIHENVISINTSINIKTETSYKDGKLF